MLAFYYLKQTSLENQVLSTGHSEHPNNEITVFMCGIAGYLGNPGLPALNGVLARMIDSIAHRGPDAQGFYAGNGVGLAHARLSIVDLSGGAQPMSCPDGEIFVTFNGEIFNYIELREELISRGLTFRTASDTEAILAAYRAFGPDCVKRFNGDFAFALWDWKSVSLCSRAIAWACVRCFTLGTKGACTRVRNQGASRRSRRRGRDRSHSARTTLTLWFPCRPDNLQEYPGAAAGPHASRDRRIGHRKKLLAAIFPGGGRRRHRRRDARAIADELAHLLEDAVRIRLRANVPVGAYLSGGLNSSIVTALMKKLSPAQLKTFSLAFEDPEFDERGFQMVLANALATDHQATVCAASDIARSFPSVVYHAEKPLVRTGPAPLHDSPAPSGGTA